VKREPQDLRSFGHCLSDNVFRKNRILTNASIRRILFSEKSLSSIVHWKLHIRNIKTSEVILKKNKLERNKPEIETMKNCKISKRPTKKDATEGNAIPEVSIGLWEQAKWSSE